MIATGTGNRGRLARLPGQQAPDTEISGGTGVYGPARDDESVGATSRAAGIVRRVRGSSPPGNRLDYHIAIAHRQGA